MASVGRVVDAPVSRLLLLPSAQVVTLHVNIDMPNYALLLPCLAFLYLPVNPTAPILLMQLVHCGALCQCSGFRMIPAALRDSRGQQPIQQNNRSYLLNHQTTRQLG